MTVLQQADFDIFVQECKYWIDFFGIKDWSINYKFKELHENFRAECRVNWSGRVCSLCLSTVWKGEVTDLDIRRSAFHEVMELLLTDFDHTVLDDKIPLEERKYLAEVQRHSLIRRFENTIFAHLR